MSTNTSTPTFASVEVIQTGARRRWTAEEKLRIVAESESGPRRLLPTARRYGLSTGQLYLWRRQAREGKLSGAADHPGFVPAIVSPDDQGCRLSRSEVVDLGNRMVVVLSNGRQVMTGPDVDVVALRRVVEVLER